MRNFLIGLTGVAGVAGVISLPFFIEPEGQTIEDRKLYDRYLCDAPMSACVATMNDGGPARVVYVEDLLTYQSRNYVESFVTASHDGGCFVHLLQTRSQHEAVSSLDGGVFLSDRCYVDEVNLPMNYIYGRVIVYPDGED